MNCKYASICSLVYGENLSENIQFEIERSRSLLQPILLPDNAVEPLPEQDIDTGKDLFKLYFNLTKFAAFSKQLHPDDTVSPSKIEEYHLWFRSFVEHWLEIFLYEALKRIDKAILLDQLFCDDESTKYTISAVNTIEIFHHIKNSWEQLNWPEIEQHYKFFVILLDEICRCSLYYADKMMMLVENEDDVDDSSEFTVTSKWCLAINNIGYIREQLTSFLVADLNIAKIITEMDTVYGNKKSDECNDMLNSLIKNISEMVESKIDQLRKTIAHKMSPSMRKYLLEVAKTGNMTPGSSLTRKMAPKVRTFLMELANKANLSTSDSRSKSKINHPIDRIMSYLEDSLSVLYSKLNKTDFDLVLLAIWDEINIILCDLAKMNVS